MNSYLDWQFDKINNFEYKLALSNNCTEEELKDLEDLYGNATSQTLAIEFENGDKKESNTVVVNDAEGYLRQTDHNKNYITLNDNGVYLTEKLAEKYNLKIGDEISWHILGNSTWYKTKIAGLNRDPQSQNINITRKYSEELGLEYKPDSLYTNADLSEVKTLAGVETIQSKQTLRILIAVSVILAYVIIYNLGILSFSEKQYQFATLKVLGFKNKQIKKIFIKQNIWLAVIGIILSLPLGYTMIDYIFKSALSDAYDFPAIIKLPSYLYTTIGSFVVAVLVNVILAKKVKTIDMVCSLKGNE